MRASYGTKSHHRYLYSAQYGTNSYLTLTGCKKSNKSNKSLIGRSRSLAVLRLLTRLTTLNYVNHTVPYNPLDNLLDNLLLAFDYRYLLFVIQSTYKRQQK